MYELIIWNMNCLSLKMKTSRCDLFYHLELLENDIKVVSAEATANSRCHTFTVHLNLNGVEMQGQCTLNVLKNSNSSRLLPNNPHVGEMQCHSLLLHSHPSCLVSRIGLLKLILKLLCIKSLYKFMAFPVGEKNYHAFPV